MKKIVITFLIVLMVFFSGCKLVNTPTDLQDNDLHEDSNITELKNNGDEGNKNTNDDSLNQDSQNLRNTTFYYKDADGLLIPVTRGMERVEGVAKAAISSTVDIPVIREDLCNLGLLPTLPGGTRINGMTIRDGIAKVDFNKEILNYSNEKNEKNIIDCIVYTLTEFYTVDNVKILIDGKERSELKHGTLISNPLQRKGINFLDGNIEDVSDDKELVEVYFTKNINSKYTYFVPVTKVIDKPSGEIDRYMKTLNALIKTDTSNTKLKSHIPQNTSIKGIQVEGQTVILDFTDEILNIAASNTELKTMLNQIALCFKQFSKIKQLKVNVNGKPLVLPGEGVGEALNIPIYVNKL